MSTTDSNTLKQYKRPRSRVEQHINNATSSIFYENGITSGDDNIGRDLSKASQSGQQQNRTLLKRPHEHISTHEQHATAVRADQPSKSTNDKNKKARFDNGTTKGFAFIDKSVATNEFEMDERKLKQRQKQVDFGKNTLGYDNYVAMVPKDQRKRGDPVTPDIFLKISKRDFDTRIRNWRRALHQYDPASSRGEKNEGEQAVLVSPVPFSNDTLESEAHDDEDSTTRSLASHVAQTQRLVSGSAVGASIFSGLY